MGQLLRWLLTVLLFSTGLGDDAIEDIKLLVDIEYEGVGEFTSYPRTITAAIRERLKIFRNVKVLERDDLEDVTRELKLSTSGLAEQTLEIGSMHVADYILEGKLTVEFIDRSFGITDWRFTLDGKLINVETTESKTVYTEGQFDEADDEETNPLNIGVTTFAYAVMDPILEQAEVHESDFHLLIEAEEDDLKELRSKGLRTAAMWAAGGAACTGYGYVLQQEEKKWYAWGGMYVLGLSFLHSGREAYRHTRDAAETMTDRIKDHKRVFYQKYNRKF